MLSDVEFTGANLTDANLSHANLVGSILMATDLVRTDLRDADLSTARLHGANLNEAKLGGAYIAFTSLFNTNLLDADVTGALVFETTIIEIDLRNVIGLDSIKHLGPSQLSLSTIYRSEGQIPEVFLRGCGVPEAFIKNLPALVEAMPPTQFYSCFISYSTKDEEFAKRLCARMRRADMRVWFAPEDVKAGQKLNDQIAKAIKLHDRLLIILSQNSIKSEWVTTEIRRARKTEVEEGRRKLFPISLVGYDAIRDWECLDADYGKDLAVEVREYYIPDFSNWKNHDDFEREFNRLYASLKAES